MSLVGRHFKLPDDKWLYVGNREVRLSGTFVITSEDHVRGMVWASPSSIPAMDAMVKAETILPYLLET